MKLQGRNLSLIAPALQGDDVKLLQSELQQLGFNIAAAEVASQTFDQSTSAAVQDFQSKNSLPATGVVDEATAAKVNAAVDALQQSFVVEGQIRGADGKPVAAMTVRAFDKDMRGENSLGETKTNADGNYRIEYTAPQFRRSDKERGGPELIVRAFDEGGAVVAASRLIRSAGQAEKVDLTIGASMATSFIVRGQVRQSDGSVFVEAEVRAYDKDLRREEPLGQAITDREGRYQIGYTAEQFRRSEKKSADLIVRVFANGDPSSALAQPDGKFPPDGKSPSPASISDASVAVTAPSLEAAAAAAPKPLVSSPVIFNARPIETVDLMVGEEEYRGPSEYELLVAELTPLMRDPLVPAADLTADDVVFLSGETGLNARHITFFAEAARLSAKTELLPEVFYGFARKNLPIDLPSLLALNAQIQRRALEAAWRDNIIPFRLRRRLEEFMDRMQQLMVKQAFESPPEAGHTSIGALLGASIAERSVQETFLSLYVQHQGSIEEFWQALRQHPNFDQPGKVDDLQLTLQLGALTRNHLPLVQEVRQNGNVKFLRDLAALDESDWLALINKQVSGQAIGFPPDVPGQDDAEKAANYALTLTRTIENAFPTPVIAHRISRDNITGKADLLKFFANSPDFDFAEAHVETYLMEKNPNALAGVSDQQSLTKQLQSLQRLTKLTSRYQEMRTLMNDGLDSAQGISQMGETTFVEKYASGFGADRAHTIFAKAQQVSAMALIIFSKYAAEMNSVNLTVVPKLSTVGG